MYQQNDVVAARLGRMITGVAVPFADISDDIRCAPAGLNHSLLEPFNATNEPRPFLTAIRGRGEGVNNGCGAHYQVKVSQQDTAGLVGKVALALRADLGPQSRIPNNFQTA